jgi:ketosteroid isomerase-like protein
LPRQGFENNGQNPANYNADEKAAVALAERWIETINNRDTDGHMALIADNILFRADPVQPPKRGARKYCSHMIGIGGGPSPDVNMSFTMSELYAVGGKGEAQVLFYRHDINGPAGTAGFLGGYPVPVAVFLRIHNGKVIEWYDMPTNKISIGALPFSIPTGGPEKTPAQCAKFPDMST